jgi:hypothetical protein
VLSTLYAVTMVLIKVDEHILTVVIYIYNVELVSFTVTEVRMS